MEHLSANLPFASELASLDIHTLKLLFSFIAACFPAYIWGYIYYQKQPEPRRLVRASFIAGMLSVTPILLYKASWTFFPQLEIFLHTAKFDHVTFSLFALIHIPLSVILSFLFVGVIEEYMKHVAVRAVDKDSFHCIDDAIEFSIIASLGFSFVENILYFYFIWVGKGFDQFFVSFIFRSIFSTFAHILFSGVYGYYYGIAFFSDPIFAQEQRAKRLPIISFIHRITTIREERLFHQEKLIEGLLAAVALHAIFDVFLEIGWTYIILPYLVIGYIGLDYLFDKKEDHINYGRVIRKTNVPPPEKATHTKTKQAKVKIA